MEYFLRNDYKPTAITFFFLFHNLLELWKNIFATDTVHYNLIRETVTYSFSEGIYKLLVSKTVS